MSGEGNNYYSDVISRPAQSTEDRNKLGFYLGSLIATQLSYPLHGNANLWSVVAPAIAGTNTLGGVLGHIATKGKKLTDAQRELLRQPTNLSILPGVGSYRDALRDSYVDDKLSGGTNKHRTGLSELLGGATAPLLFGGLTALAVPAIGALVGGVKDWSDARDGASSGFKIGLGAAGLLSAISYLIGKRLAGKRTNEEHRKYLEKSVLANYIIPGVATYNRGRRRALSEL